MTVEYDASGLVSVSMDELKALLPDPLETKWCPLCKLPVEDGHKHWRDLQPIEEVREADAYVGLYKSVAKWRSKWLT